MEPPRHSTRMIVPAPEPPDTVLAPHTNTRSTHPSRYTLIHVATVHRRPLHAARRSHYRTLLCSTGQTIRLQSSLERSTSLSELVCGPTQAGAYHTRSILHALALADNPRAPHASTSPSYRPYPPPEPHPQMAQRRLHTASSQLHHSFITASSQLHHRFITASSQLHHSFITASSPLHHSFITASSPLHHSFITASSPLHHRFITASSPLHHGFITATSSTPLTVMLNHPIPNHARRAWHGRHITRLLIRASAVFAHGSSIAIVAVPVTILSQL